MAAITTMMATKIAETALVLLFKKKASEEKINQSRICLTTARPKIKTTMSSSSIAPVPELRAPRNENMGGVELVDDDIEMLVEVVLLPVRSIGVAVSEVALTSFLPRLGRLKIDSTVERKE